MAQTAADIELGLRIKLLEGQAQLKKLTRAAAKDIKAGLEPSFRAIAEQQMVVTKAQNELNNVVKKGRIHFAGYALSIMFFGQALKQMSMGVARFGVKAFNDVMHSVEGTVTQSDYLSSSMKYLGFTIGEALQPIIAWLVPIIDKLADWVSQNEETAASIIAIGAVAGTVFAVGGAAVLAVNGFIELLTKLGVTTIDAEGKITNLGSTLKSLGGVIAIGYALKKSKDAFDEFRNGNIYSGIIDGLSAGLSGFGGIRLLQGKKGGGALIALGVALDLVGQGKFFQTLGLLVAPIVAFTNTVIDLLQAMFDQGIGNGMKLGVKAAVETVMNSSMLMLILDLATGGKASSAISRYMDDALPTSLDFDFGSVFSGRLGEARQLYRDWDNAITDFINAADEQYNKNISDADYASRQQQYVAQMNIYLESNPNANNAEIANAVIEAMRSRS